MNSITKILLGIICLAILLFSAFGFITTFEPLDTSTQITFRIVYGLLGITSILSLLFILFKKKK